MAQRTLTTPANGSPTAESTSVLVRVPADKDYIVLIRSAAGHLGAQTGLTVAEITDLRLAVDEACGLLLAPRAFGGLDIGDGELECRFDIRPDALHVVVRAEVRAEAGVVEACPDPTSFGWTIMSALVDEVAWNHDGAITEVGLVKRRLVREV
jgi:serine/threonine-protein kinase RsbW